jgi:hypothetical protein
MACKDGESRDGDSDRIIASSDSIGSGPGYEFDPRKTVKTYIQSGPQEGVHEDGIHLTQELQQYSSLKNSTPAKERLHRQ